MGGQSKRLVVMAGDTGEHMFPGLAVAHHLVTQGWQVRWLSAADRTGADLVPRHDIEIDFIRISGLRGRDVNTLLTALVRIFNTWRQAHAIMKQFKPDVAPGMGGYVSGPGGLAAWSLGIPVVLHEQSGIAGLTNKWLAKIATKVMQAFPGVFPNAEVVGNPVRIGVLALPLPETRLAGREGPARILVVGGSQGARVLNQTIPQVATKFGGVVTIWHQNGRGAQQTVEQVYADTGQPQHKVTEFIDDMTAAYAWANIVVRRSGTLTIDEIVAAGLPALLVPFQHKDQQQYQNALPPEKAGAAKILKQPQFTVDAIANALSGWSRETLLTMAGHARTASIPDATERVANEVNRAARA